MQDRPGVKVVAVKESVLQECLEAWKTSVVQGSLGAKVVCKRGRRQEWQQKRQAPCRRV